MPTASFPGPLSKIIRRTHLTSWLPEAVGKDRAKSRVTTNQKGKAGEDVHRGFERPWRGLGRGAGHVRVGGLCVCSGNVGLTDEPL